MKKTPFNPIFLLLLLLVFPFCKSEKKVQVDVVTVRLESDPDRLNPMLSSVGFATDVFRYMFYPLVDIDPATLELKPVLVTNLPVKSTVKGGENDGLTSYEFEILPEAKWDNGSDITANDFIFTLKAVFNPAVGAERWRALLSFIKDVKIDDCKFKIAFK